MTPKIEKIIVKYLTNSATLSDLNILSKWIESDSNKELFKNYAKTHLAINYSINDPNTPYAVERLLRTIREEKSFVYKIKKEPIYRYVVAASVILMVALIGFLNKGDSITELQPVIVDTNAIEPGTDKAKLTLGDGSTIELEKGNSFQKKNLSSNGEEIIYAEHSSASKEIEYNYLTIPRGGQFYLVLSDGTRVWLNSESQLKYPVAFIKGTTRSVELVYGEAYFDVSPSTEHNGSKFNVLNKSQKVNVLGTEFNIKAYKDETNVYTTLVEGKVLVGYDGKKQNLTPNEQSDYDIMNNTLKVDIVDVDSEVSWRNKVFSFDNKSLRDIMRVISRWYDVDVVFKNQELELIKFNGIFSKHQSIEEILSTIKSSSINNYEISDKTIILE